MTEKQAWNPRAVTSRRNSKKHKGAAVGVEKQQGGWCDWNRMREEGRGRGTGREARSVMGERLSRAQEAAVWTWDVELAAAW